jgi:hypothetical protein
MSTVLDIRSTVKMVIHCTMFVDHGSVLGKVEKCCDEYCTRYKEYSTDGDPLHYVCGSWECVGKS